MTALIKLSDEEIGCCFNTDVADCDLFVKLSPARNLSESTPCEHSWQATKEVSSGSIHALTRHEALKQKLRSFLNNTERVTYAVETGHKKKYRDNVKDI